jgi:hypothetical protein
MSNVMQSPFEAGNVQVDADIIVVNDFFSDELVGGAELTTDAIITELECRGMRTCRVRSRELTPQLIIANRSKLWLVCNFSSATAAAMATFVKHARYVIVEYDFKFCSSRSPDKHAAEQRSPCKCGQAQHGKFVSQLYSSAMLVVWMSQRQRDATISACADMKPRAEIVASSVFSDETLERLLELRRERALAPDDGKWLVLRSDSWIKGTQQSLQAAIAANKQYELIGSISYDEMLQRLMRSAGIVYTPPGGDTCPRYVIEAQLLGVGIVCNDNVMHLGEPWAQSTGEELAANLRMKRKQLGDVLVHLVRPSISGYVTTLNAVKQDYPIEACVRSMLHFCTEVIVCDGGSTDSTVQRIVALADPRIRIIEHRIDPSAPDFALEDGRQKARARAACSGDYCWQQDADEIVDVRDAADIMLMATRMPQDVLGVTLPVVEFWGSLEKIRCDVTPWKWRISRNDPDITHGVPIDLRRRSAEGHDIAAHGTDGCDMISVTTGQRVQFVSFMTAEAERDRLLGLAGDSAALQRYAAWFNTAIVAVPPVFHVSWLDIGRKLRLYRDYWTAHWASLYGEQPTNFFFDKSWSDVTDAELDDLATKLRNIGGWIWHRPWDGTRTPSIMCDRPIPRSITIGA